MQIETKIVIKKVLIDFDGAQPTVSFQGNLFPLARAVGDAPAVHVQQTISKDDELAQALFALIDQAFERGIAEENAHATRMEAKKVGSDEG